MNTPAKRQRVPVATRARAISVPSDRQLRLVAVLCAVLLLLIVQQLQASPNASTVDAADAESAASWTQWRGPDRDGSVGGARWPDDFAGLERGWSVELGKGYGGAIVAGDRVFVVETVDEQTEQVRALRRTDGTEIWRYSWQGGMDVPFFAKRNGNWVRSTPAFDGERLFVGGMQERFFALDAGSGELVWSIDFPKAYDTRQPDFGFSSSPMVDDGAVYVQAATSLFKLDAASGDVIWRALEGADDIMSGGAFSSPTIAELHGQRQLLVQTRSTLHGLDPDTGESLWSHDVPSFRGMNILTPTVYDNSVFTSTHRNNTFFYRIAQDGNGFQVNEAWTHKAHGYMSSPVIIDGHAYLHLGNRRMVCIDLATGEDKWTSEPLSEYLSMTYQNDRILALGAEGTLYLIRATPERLEIVDQKEAASESSWAHLAIAGDEIYVRSLEGLARWTWPRGTGAAGAPSAE